MRLLKIQNSAES